MSLGKNIEKTMFGGVEKSFASLQSLPQRINMAKELSSLQDILPGHLKDLDLKMSEPEIASDLLPDLGDQWDKFMRTSKERAGKKSGELRGDPGIGVAGKKTTGKEARLTGTRNQLADRYDTEHKLKMDAMRQGQESLFRAESMQAEDQARQRQLQYAGMMSNMVAPSYSVSMTENIVTPERNIAQDIMGGAMAVGSAVANAYTGGGFGAAMGGMKAGMSAAGAMGGGIG